VTSALGASPDQVTGRVLDNASPSRVLDPFLWAVTLDRREIVAPIALVIDASSTAAAIPDGTPDHVWEQLTGLGDVTTYCLGQETPIATGGQHPPIGTPRVGRQRLIGPILDQAPHNTRIVVMTSGPIIDLPDFARSPWRDRIIIAAVDSSVVPPGWLHAPLYHGERDTAMLVDAVLHL